MSGGQGYDRLQYLLAGQAAPVWNGIDYVEVANAAQTQLRGPPPRWQVGLDASEDVGRGGTDVQRHSVRFQDDLMRRRLVRKAAHRTPQVSSIAGHG